MTFVIKRKIVDGRRRRQGVARGSDVRAMVRSAIDALGGISRFVQSRDVVVIKPNVAFERAAPLGATSNPEVVAELVNLVREAGASEVRVADNPIESPESCFVRSGVRRAALEAGARVFLPSPGDFETLHVKGAKWIQRWPFFWRPFDGADKVIGVAPVKDHNLCRASMTTKNWYGLLGGRRNQFHQDIHGIITDLALMMRPTLVVSTAPASCSEAARPVAASPTCGPGRRSRRARTRSPSTPSAGMICLRDVIPTYLRPEYLAQAEEKGLKARADWRSLGVKEAQVG